MSPVSKAEVVFFFFLNVLECFQYNVDPTWALFNFSTAHLMYTRVCFVTSRKRLLFQNTPVSSTEEGSCQCQCMAGDSQR